MRNSCQIDIYLLVTTRLVKMTNIPTMCWWCCLTQTGELISSNFVLFWQQTTTSTLSLSMVTLGKVNVSRAEVRADRNIQDISRVVKIHKSMYRTQTYIPGETRSSSSLTQPEGGRWTGRPVMAGLA